jgi:hypothetical protein
MEELSQVFNIVFYYPPPKSVKINDTYRSLIDEWVIQIIVNDEVLYQMDLETVYFTSEKIKFLDQLCISLNTPDSKCVVYHPTSISSLKSIQFLDYPFLSQKDWSVKDFTLQCVINLPKLNKSGRTFDKLKNIVKNKQELINEIYIHNLWNIKSILKWCSVSHRDHERKTEETLNISLLEDIIKFLLVRKQVWVLDEIWITYLNKYYNDKKHIDAKYNINQVVEDIVRYKSGDSSGNQWCKETYFSDCVKNFKLSNSTGDLSVYMSEELENVVGTQEELNDLFTIASFMINYHIGFESVYPLYDMIHVFSQNLRELEFLDKTDYTNVYSEDEFTTKVFEFLNKPPMNGTVDGVKIIPTMWSICVKLENNTVKYVNKLLGIQLYEINNIINNLLLLLKTNAVIVELKSSVLVEGLVNSNKVYFTESKLNIKWSIIKNIVKGEFKCFKQGQQYYVKY